MKKFFNKLSLFNRYLILFFMLAFIPAITACLGLFFSHKELYKEIISSNQAAVNLTQVSLDTKIQEFSKVIALIEQEPTLTRNSLQTSRRTALASLEKIISQQDFLSNIIIKIRGTDYYYSADGAYFARDLKYQPFIIDLTKNNYSIEEWAETLETIRDLTYWPVNTYGHSPQYLYLFSPVHSNFQIKDSNTSRVMALLIKQEYIQELFRSSQTDMSENILLLNSDMELLSHLAPYVTEDSIRSLCDYLKTASTLESMFHLELEGFDNIFFIAQSRETGLYYVRFLPEDIAFQTIHRIETYTFLLLFFVIVLGVCLILVAMKNSYAPIRTLADWLRSNQLTTSENKDELSIFKQVFDDVIEENASLSQKVSESRQVLIDHFLTALIRGNFSTEETFLNACKNLGIDFNKKYFSVCSILLEKTPKEKESIADFDRILETIRQNLPDFLRVQVKDLLFAEKLLLVFCSDTSDSEAYYQAVNDIKTRLFLQNNLLSTIGVGSFYDSFEHVGKSYLESVNALDYRMIHGKNCLITPDMYNINQPELSYPTGELESLHTALNARNADNALAVIQRLYHYSKSQHCTLHAAKYICYDTFSILKKMPAFVKIGYVNTLSQNLNITHLTDFETIDDFFTALMDIVQKIMVPEDNEENETKNSIGPELVNYISTHCFSYDFQITGMAEHFHISPQYMRRLFKKHTGISLSDYIMDLKLEKAKQLLRDTDMTLQNIVVEIGNTDVSGYIRLFKQKTGMTPGQYRKANQIPADEK